MRVALGVVVEPERGRQALEERVDGRVEGERCDDVVEDFARGDEVLRGLDELPSVREPELVKDERDVVHEVVRVGRIGGLGCLRGPHVRRGGRGWRVGCGLLLGLLRDAVVGREVAPCLAGEFDDGERDAKVDLVTPVSRERVGEDVEGRALLEREIGRASCRERVS